MCTFEIWNASYNPHPISNIIFKVFSFIQDDLCHTFCLIEKIITLTEKWQLFSPHSIHMHLFNHSLPSPSMQFIKTYSLFTILYVIASLETVSSFTIEEGEYSISRKMWAIISLGKRKRTCMLILFLLTPHSFYSRKDCLHSSQILVSMTDHEEESWDPRTVYF